MIQSDPQDEPPVYAVRVTALARRALEEAKEWQAQNFGPLPAARWYDGMLAAIRSLATYPERCPVAPEDLLYSEGTVRVLLFRLRRGGPAWRILFTVHEADSNDPPTVRVHLLRYGAQSPLTEWPDEQTC